MRRTLLILLLTLAFWVPFAAGAAAPEPPPAPPAPESGTLEAPPWPGPPGAEGRPGERVPPEIRELIKKRMERRLGELEGAKRPHPAPGVGPLPILAFWLVPATLFVAVAAVVIAALVVVHKSRLARYQVVAAALKEGKEIPPQLLTNGYGRHDGLGGGLLLVALGLGLAIALGVAVAPTHAVWGVVPLLLGVALLITAALRRRGD